MTADNDDDDRPTAAEMHKLLNSIPSYSQRRVHRIFQGATRTFGRGEACRVVWEGPLMPNGSIPPILGGLGRRTERHRAIYRLKHGFLARADRIVAVCGSDRCLDVRHLRIIPAPKVPKVPRLSPAQVAADTAAAIAFGGAATTAPSSATTTTV